MHLLLHATRTQRARTSARPLLTRCARTRRAPGALVYCSDPTWGNHHTIFQKSGLETKKYRYLTPQMTLDFEGMVFPRPSAPLACHASRAGLT